MQNNESINIQVQSTATLIKASISAVVIGIIVLVIAILPAEYNIDPTGIGAALGLTEIAQASESKAIKSSTDNVNIIEKVSVEQMSIENLVILNAPTVAEIAQTRQLAGIRSDVIDIVIPANKGLEYKLLVNEHGHFEYEWKTDGNALYFDFHGEPQGDTSGYYESYAITTATEMKGSLTTPFAGNHGWYWKNTTNEPVTVTLNTKGTYKIKG
ncbi:hypothetical protein [Shewanella sp. OMA3-2]|uniref:hypothetical protein n=1 Tax=Shewanella sp. OMA3-2 TaxID=2908650 RepID=UPI001F375898|nr:hypothetical protein [Shewanella sp. OMA3-2]UJF21117.1 hypothetical protein L0B17_13300 [Shewanella sp. OMA3-2]